MSIPGATDTEVFRSYARDVFCSTLRPGELVMINNLASHKSDPALRLIRKAGTKVLFLSAYSSDLNPIKKVEQSQSLAM